MADEQRLTMFLEILAAVGGLQDASDYSCNWINAFCSEHEGSEPDTFNRAHDLGYTTVSHDSDTDHSEVRITQLGRDFLIRPSTPPTPEQMAKDRSMDVDEIVRGLSKGQKRMVLASEPGGWGREDCATGVEIRGAQYRTARALELVGVGTYTHGSPISDLYFNNAHGLAVRARLLEQDHG